MALGAIPYQVSPYCIEGEVISQGAKSFKLLYFETKEDTLSGKSVKGGTDQVSEVILQTVVFFLIMI